MIVKYVRFLNAVGSPGYAGQNITKARRNCKAAEQLPTAERMDEIEVVDDLIVLRVARVDQRTRQTRVWERYTPLANCVDFEPWTDDDELEEQIARDKDPRKPAKEKKT